MESSEPGWAQAGHVPPEVGEALDTTWPQKPECWTERAAQKSWLVEKATSSGTKACISEQLDASFRVMALMHQNSPDPTLAVQS